jgi:hypothetical protein
MSRKRDEKSGNEWTRGRKGAMVTREMANTDREEEGPVAMIAYRLVSGATLLHGDFVSGAYGPLLLLYSSKVTLGDGRPEKKGIWSRRVPVHIQAFSEPWTILRRALCSHNSRNDS